MNTRLNLKTRFIWEKKKHTIISELPWCNVLRRAILDFCGTINFPDNFVGFRFKIYILKKELASMLIHIRKIFNCRVSFTYRLINYFQKAIFRKKYHDSNGSRSDEIALPVCYKEKINGMSFSCFWKVSST